MSNKFCTALLYGSYPGIEYSVGLDFARGVKSAFDQVVRIDHKQLIREMGFSKSMVRIRDILHAERVDIVIWFMDSDFDFEVDFFLKLQESFFMVMHVGDGEQYFDRSARYYAQAFDLVLTAGYLNKFQFEQYGVSSIFFPSGFAVDSGLLSQHVEQTYSYQVAFIGPVLNKVGRKFYIDTLIDHGIDMALFGAGTKRGVVSRDKMFDIYRTSMINLNFTGVSDNCILDYDITINRRIKTVKGRCQEIALAGGFVLSEYAPGIEKLFEIGSEIAVFHNKAELLHQVSYYLKHEDERKAMATRAHARAVADYDETHQWKKLRQTIGQQIAVKHVENNVIYLDKIFKKAFSTTRLSRFIDCTLQAKWSHAIDELMVFIKYPIVDIRIFLYDLRRIAARRIPWVHAFYRKFR